MGPDAVDSIALGATAADGPPDAAAAAIRAALVDGAAKLLAAARYYVRITGLARGTAVREVAEEALQELARRALESAARYRPGVGAPLAWLKGILLNIVRQLRDERCRHARVYPTPAGEDEAARDGEDFDRFIRLAGLGEEPQDPEARAAERQELDRCLALLLPHDRELLELSVLYEFDYDEVAARLATTPGAARVRRSRALKRLRQALREKGGQR